MTNLTSASQRTSDRPSSWANSSWANCQYTLNQSRTWFFLLTALGAMSNVLYTCTAPFIGFAAIAGTTLPRRRAIATLSSMWLINQVLGFTIRQYPWAANTFAWGGVMLLGALGATVLASWRSQRSVKGFGNWLAGVAAIGFAGYVLYELLLWLAGFVLGGASGFTLPILWQVLTGNAIWAVGLVSLYCLLVWRLMRTKY